MVQTWINRLKPTLIIVLIYTTFLAGFDYYDGKEFQLAKYIFTGTLFGLIMFFLIRNNSKIKNDATKE